MRNTRTLYDVNQSNKRLRIEDHITPGNRDSSCPDVHFLLTMIEGPSYGIAVEPDELAAALNIAIDPDQLARQLDGIVPGFHASYREPVQEEPQLDAERIEQLILMLKSNGYDVVKQADPGAEYVNGLLQFASQIPTTTDSGKLASQGAHEILDWAERASWQAGSNDLRDVEVYVEIDRAMLLDEIQYAINSNSVDAVVGGERWTHLWPVVVRIDESSDLIIHVTSGERAQGGASARAGL